mgnify:CR=1 FL=1
MKNVKQILSFALMGTLAFGANAYAEDSIRIVSWGGAYQKGQSIGIFQPAAKAMGITVKEDTYGGISDVKLMVKSGGDKFDMFSSGAGSCASGGAEGVLEKLDYSIIERRSPARRRRSPSCPRSPRRSPVARASRASSTGVIYTFV